MKQNIISTSSIRLPNLFIFLLSLTMVCGCGDYLDLVPDDVPTMELAFNNRQNASRFLYTCYGYMPQAANVQSSPALETGDEVWNCYERGFYYTNQTSYAIAQGRQNASSPLLNYWSGGNNGSNLFIALRDCNIFLENIGNVLDLEQSERDRWIAEVKVLKAYYHYFLMQIYGAIPIIRENIPVSADPAAVQVVREPVDDVIKYIVGLIDEATADKESAMPSLPLNIRSQDTELGRLTLPAALAIKAKILTLAASPLFNGNPDFKNFKNEAGKNFINPDEDPTRWEAARDACREAIEYSIKGGHKLYEFDDYLMYEVSDTTMHELTLRNTITSRFNKELIWGLGDNGVLDLQSLSNAPLTAWHQGHQLGDNRMFHNPTLTVVEQFYTRNGVPIEEDKTYNYNDRYKVFNSPAEGHGYYLIQDFRTAYLNMYREPRYYAWLGFDGGKWFNMEATDDKSSFGVRAKANETAGQGNENFSITGYFAKKLVSYKIIMTQASSNIGTTSYTFPIIRLSDLYLLYAEALNECKSQPDNEVYEYIQKVRDKAGLDKETGGLVETWQAFSDLPDKPTTKIGMRDIIRRERLIELSFEGQRFYDLRRWRLSFEYLNRPIRGWNVSEKDETGYYRETYIFNRKFDIKDYFWPIRQQDLYVNPKLIQNYGW